MLIDRQTNWSSIAKNMKILTRHIGTTIILAIMMVLLALIGLQIFISFINEMGDIGTGHYGLWQAIQITILSLPHNIYGFFPMAGLLGSLMGLGYLASNRELIVMRAAGMSLLQIIGAVLCAAIFLLIFATFIGEVIGPQAENIAKVKKEFATTGVQTSATIHGLWLRKHRDFIYIRDILPDRNLRGIYRYHFADDNQLLSIGYAESGVYKSREWLLQNFNVTELHKNSVTMQKIPNKTWHLKIDLKLLSTSRIDPTAISLLKLYKLIRFRHANGLSVQQYAFTFWQRIIQPLATLIMIFLAIPFIFGPLRTVAMGLRILTGVIVGFAFYLLNQFVGPFSLVYQIPPFICAVFPSVMFLGIGCFLMCKLR